MLFRALSQVTRQSLTKIGNVTRPQQRHMSAPALKEPHMNDILIPHEPFEVGYRKRQKVNYLVLVTGIVMFAATCSYVFTRGVIFPNLTPPKKNLSN